MWLLSPSSEMLMTAVVMFVDNHATVVVARDDVEHFACHCSSVRIKRWANAGCPLGMFQRLQKDVGASEARGPGGPEQAERVGERRKGVTVRGRERGVKDGERRKWDGTRKGEGEGRGRRERERRGRETGEGEKGRGRQRRRERGRGECCCC